MRGKQSWDSALGKTSPEVQKKKGKQQRSKSGLSCQSCGLEPDESQIESKVGNGKDLSDRAVVSGASWAGSVVLKRQFGELLKTLIAGPPDFP